MEIRTFNTVLTGLCDAFDELIAPKKISRSNTNIIYLILKAIAKGYELINNVSVRLSNKFIPDKCALEDLDSSASLVGTERYKGSASGLRILITNNSNLVSQLQAGVYTYALDEDTIFEFEVIEPAIISSNSYITVIAMSQKIGSFHVTEQPSISVESDQPISSALTFSCSDNSALLGRPAETNLEFRKRILSDVERQDSMKELEDKLKALPYLFDCKVKYNNSLFIEQYDGINIPPFTALICYSGAVKREIAEVVCSKIICPTVRTETSVAVPYVSETFVNGQHIVYITPFKKTQYDVDIYFKVNATYIDPYEAQTQIRTALFNKFVSEVHVDFVKEDDIYNTIESLGLSGIELLAVNLKYNGEEVNYIEVPQTRTPEIRNITFIQR